MQGPDGKHNELQASLQETGRLSAVSEKLRRSENEFKKQIEVR